jgi:DNA-binding HxlR family transcriptional regulator
MVNKTEAIESLREKVFKGDVFSDQCPSRTVLNHVTSRWGVLVLLALMDGETHRFSELRDKIMKISEKMLAQTLQALERDGFVKRTVYPVVPPHVEYELTPSGHEVAVRVNTLADWLEGNIFEIMNMQKRYDTKRLQ